MGPRPFSRGYFIYTNAGSFTYVGFNGATAFQPWILSPRFISQRCSDMLQWGHGLSAVDTGKEPCKFNGANIASMGPRPFSRGYLRPASVGDLVLSASMGPRPFSRGYTAAALAAPAWCSELQWGHGLSAVDTQRIRCRIRSLVLLQWGHGLSAVDTRRHARQLHGERRASMGPRPFSRGYGLK